MRVEFMMRLIELIVSILVVLVVFVWVMTWVKGIRALLDVRFEL